MSYTYGDAQHKHAVTGLSNGDSFSYDANGSMITRSVGGQTFNLSYNAENRMTGVTGAATANFVYDDTGARVIAAEGVTTTVYVGSYFEWHGSISDTVKYYYAGTVRVAMRKGDGQAQFLLGDHLGSTNRLVHADGTPVTPGGMRLYKAWGETRYEPDGELATEYRFTGQFEDGYIDFYWMNSRWYDSSLSRWIQPDRIVPLVMQGTQAWDRLSYVNNSPIKYKDPSGHTITCALDSGLGCDGDGGLRPIDIIYGSCEDNHSILRGYLRHHPSYHPDFDPSIQASSPEYAAISTAMLQVSQEQNRSVTVLAVTGMAGNTVLARGDLLLAWDTTGNAGLFYATGGGISTPGSFASGSFSVTVVNAPSINNLIGKGTSMGGTVFTPVSGPSVGIEVDKIPGPDPNSAAYTGIGLSFGIAAGSGGVIYGTYTETDLILFWGR